MALRKFLFDERFPNHLRVLVALTCWLASVFYLAGATAFSAAVLMGCGASFRQAVSILRSVDVREE